MDKLIFDAVKLGRIETVKTLLSRGADVNARDPFDNTLLHFAVLKKDKEIMKLLIESGADINFNNIWNGTALYFAVQHGTCGKKPSKSIVDMLINLGADVNLRCGVIKGRTPLQEAASIGDIDIVRLLISNGGAEVNAEDRFGQTALHFAAGNVVTEDPTIFELLLSANANINATIGCNLTPLHVLCMSKPSKESISFIKIIQVFHKYGADFDALAADNQTIMDCAICLKNTTAVKALILSGKVDIHSYHTPDNDKFDRQSYKRTILHGACNQVDLPTVKFLLKNGANINAVDYFRKSPLLEVLDHMIYNHNSGGEISKGLEVLKYLLNLYPDVNTITTDGRSILNSCYLDYDFPDYLWKTILEHLAKLKANNNEIHSILCDIINEKSEYEDYFTKCIAELESAKRVKLHSDSWVTFFNLLIDNKRTIFQYTGNKNLSKNLNKKRIIKKFPIYGLVIYDKFTKALGKRLIYDEAIVILSDVLPINIDPTNNIIKKIVSFLNSKDLKKLCN